MSPEWAAGLTVRAVARWPDSDGDTAPSPIPGFAVSSFSPLVAAVAERCLSRQPDPAARRPGIRTAVVLVSRRGDVGTAAAVAQAVDSGRRVAPLLFFQSVPNSVVGHIAARWALTGPVVCISPVGEPVADGIDVAALLIADGDADEALVVAAEQGCAGGGRDTAVALLLAPLAGAAAGAAAGVDSGWADNRGGRTP